LQNEKRRSIRLNSWWKRRLSELQERLVPFDNDIGGELDSEDKSEVSWTGETSSVISSSTFFSSVGSSTGAPSSVSSGIWNFWDENGCTVSNKVHDATGNSNSEDTSKELEWLKTQLEEPSREASQHDTDIERMIHNYLCLSDQVSMKKSGPNVKKRRPSTFTDPEMLRITLTPSSKNGELFRDRDDKTFFLPERRCNIRSNEEENSLPQYRLFSPEREVKEPLRKLENESSGMEAKINEFGNLQKHSSSELKLNHLLLQKSAQCSKFQCKMEENEKVSSILFEQLNDSNRKVEELEKKVKDLKNEQTIEEKKYNSELEDIESCIVALCSLDMMNEEEHVDKQESNEKPFKLSTEKIVWQEEMNIHALVNAEGKKRVYRVVQEDDDEPNVTDRSIKLKVREIGDEVKKLRIQLDSRCLKLKKLLNFVKRFKDHLSGDHNECFGKVRGKYDVLSTTVLKIIGSWLELLSSTSSESSNSKQRANTKDGDCNVKKFFYDRLSVLCRQFLSCLTRVSANSALNMVGHYEGRTRDLEERMKETLANMENEGDLMYGNEIDIEKLLEHLELMKYVQDQRNTDLSAADIDNVTVEARVLVKEKPWCLLKWCPKSQSTRDSQKSNTAGSNLLWLAEGDFIAKFHIFSEVYKFPPFLCVIEDKSEERNYINSLVFKYLTSDIKIEELISAAKQVINFSSEENEIICSKFERPTPTS